MYPVYREYKYVFVGRLDVKYICEPTKNRKYNIHPSIRRKPKVVM